MENLFLPLSSAPVTKHFACVRVLKGDKMESEKPTQKEKEIIKKAKDYIKKNGKKNYISIKDF